MNGEGVRENGARNCARGCRARASLTRGGGSVMLCPAQPGKGMHVRFFEELKRRYAIRIAGLYLVGAWLVTPGQ